jgi:hypothetical protein
MEELFGLRVELGAGVIVNLDAEFHRNVPQGNSQF